MSEQSDGQSHEPQWRRRPEARAQEILESALVMFANRGFAATTIDEIASGAKVSKGTLYLYFADKEAIFKSLITERIIPKLAHLIQSVISFQGTSLDLIRLTVRGLGYFLQHDPGAVLLRIILAEAGNFPELARFYESEVTDRGLGLVETIVRRGVEEGEFRDVNPEHAAALIINPVMFIAFWHAESGTLAQKAHDFGGYIETHLDFVTRALTASQSP